MDIRNIQKSGNTYYIYLPAAWCKQNSITTKSQVVLETSSEGNLLVLPYSSERIDSTLTINLKEHDMKIINKFLVGAYLNPIKSFTIKLDRRITSLDILDQKKLIGGVEVVEFGEDQIMCESSMTVEDPGLLLRTMIKKVANMLHVMMKNSTPELLQRYEEEIDRSNMLITKSVMSSMMFRTSTRLRNIDLFYMALLSKNLEGLADNLPRIKKNESMQKTLMELMNLLLKTLESMTVDDCVCFAKEVGVLSASIDKCDKTHYLAALRSHLSQLVEIIVDWAITKEVDKGK
jgi:phosphate uptake regulator